VISLQIIKTDIPELLILEPKCFGDNRGWFMETYSLKTLKEVGITTEFVQDNQSMSEKKCTLRGLHFQNPPKAQTKLVRCTRGAILDVAVDIRRGSPTYLKWIAEELTAQNKRQLYIPKGFAHGFLTLDDDTEIQYKVDEYYAPECDRSIRYNDPEIGVNWGDIELILSQKDMNAPLLKDSDFNFNF
jgi:dTDP-4-dehydrorhamnose 3,5-epimerase